MLHLRVMATRGLCALAVSAVFAASIGAQAAKPLPLKYVGPATVSAITPGDLMTRLYIYADDSMGGRDVGTEYHLKATAYIEREVRRLGLVPGGDNGGYFQNIHTIVRGFDTLSTMTVAGATFRGGSDFLASTAGTKWRYDSVKVLVWGGTVLDTLNAPRAEVAAGMFVVLRPLTALPPGFDQAAQAVFLKTQGYQNYLKMTQVAAGLITVAGEQFAAARVTQAVNPPDRLLSLESNKQGQVQLAVTNHVMAAVLGMSADSARGGMVGKAVSLDLHFTDSARPGRNVVAILPGSDSRLKSEYVAIGAHNDHVGTGLRLVGEHDSLKVFNTIGRPAGAEGGHIGPVSPEEWATINRGIDSLRKIYPPRPDSIYNGADDDGTGTVSVLELAEAFAKGRVKPKRSIIFVWHAGEEHGMWGSGYFMDNPTIPRDSIVAQLNIDMIGRGAPTDVTGQKMGGGVLHGGDRYVQLVGSRRLSTELGDLVEKVNTGKKHGFSFDYNIDADGHPQNIYCRSDHWSYAKWGVPVVFFTTGGHADYHQVTDEPQYIRYDHMAALDSLIFDIAVAAANLDHRVVVDKPKPNPAPAAACRQ